MSDELVMDRERAVSFISQYRYYQIHAVYNHLIGNNDEAYKYYKRVLDCWDDYSHQKNEHMLTYVSHIHNYLNICVVLEEYDAFEKILEKAKKEIKPRNPHEEAVVFEHLHYPELLYLMNGTHFEKLDKFISEIQPKLKKYSGRMDTSAEHAFHCNITIILFLMGKYKEAFEGCNVIIRQKLRTRIDTQCCAWILKLAVSYEEQDDNFDNLYRAAQRFFRKISKKEIKEVHSLCLEYIYKLHNTPTLNVRSMCVEFKLKLEELYLDSQQHTVGLQEMLIWIEHIISDTSMLELLKQRNTKSRIETTQAMAS